MKYYHDFVVRYQDTDDHQRLRLNLVEQYLLEAAGHVADELGFGVKVLHPRNLGWILTHMSIEMDDIPTYLEHIRFETWIESVAHKLTTRVYRIYRVASDGSLHEIGRCRSVWAVLDLTKREIVDIYDEPMFDGSIDGEVLEMSRMPRLRMMPEVDFNRADSVRYSDLDYNGHCNSCQYLLKMLDMARPDLEHPVRLDLIYTKEVHEGESITLGVKRQEDGVQYQVVNSENELSAAAYVRTY